jgi:mitochondrial ATPase complex subunit ATP10
MLRPYFREWGNLQYQEGKSFIAPPRLFRADRSLYFPNLFGRTLLKRDRKPRDTTPALQGRASVVAVFSTQWAENQVLSFISKEENPALHQVLTASRGKAQLVQINVEENWLKAWVVRLFAGSLRRRIEETNWGKYFFVRRGITNEIRECVGLLNSKVGYVYLVDQECRIRWAGSGPSQADEREGLAKGVQRVLDEIQKGATTTREPPPGVSL